MNTYEVEVTKTSQGLVTVQADSEDAAWEIARDAVNNSEFTPIREQFSLQTITLAPDKLPEITEDTTPEEIEKINAINSSLVTLNDSVVSKGGGIISNEIVNNEIVQ